MKLSEIVKFSNRLKQHNEKWEYSELQLGLLEQIRKDVDGFHLANIIISKYMNHKTKPTIDQIGEVISSMKVREDSDEYSGCTKCRNGFVTIFNHKKWYYDIDLQDFIENSWNPELLQSIFMLPTMEVICSCKDMKRMVKISSYLKWLEKFGFIAQEFYEMCYAQLYIFYSQQLDGTLKFDEFDPWRFWGVESESNTSFSISSIINHKLKDLLLDIESGGMGINLREGIRTVRGGLRQIDKKDEELL